VLTTLALMIIEGMARFIVYKLVNITLQVDCDNLPSSKEIRGASLA